MKPKIVFTGGGTGGHIFPIIAIKRALVKQKPDYRFFYLGPIDSYQELLQKEGFIVIPILSGKLRRYLTIEGVFKTFLDLFKLPIGFLKAFWVLLKIKPNLIFSKGGYGAIPIIFAGSILKIPIFVHEADSIASLSTRISQKFAKKIFISFPKTSGLNVPEDKIICSGNPIRKELLTGSKEVGEKIFQITKEKPVILILGGSQGSQRINNVIIKSLKNLLETFEIIHQVGARNFKDIASYYKFFLPKELQKYYHFYGFLNEEQLKHAFKVAHLVISRAGSGAIFEIAANGKASVLIPLQESAQNHQRSNAYQYAQYGAAIVVEEQNFKPNFLIELLKELFSKFSKIKQMEHSAQLFAKPKAADIIAHHIINFLSNGTIKS